MAAQESCDPNPLRLPRRGDKVVAAPKAPGCFTGTVNAYASQRLSVKTDGKHGLVHIEFSRFTWSPRRKAWVCWPMDVIKTIKALEKMDEAPMLPRPKDFAGVGDFMLVDKRAGWVKRLQGRPTALPEQRTSSMNITAMRGYIVGTAKGDVTVEVDRARYEVERRLWIATIALEDG